MVAFPEYRPQSFGNSLATGLQLSAAVDDMRDKREQRRRKDEAQQFLEPALAGDQGAFVKLAAADPQSANAVGMMLSRLDTRKQAALKDAADFTTQMGMGVLNAPPDQQASAYAAALAEAKRRGMDTSSWPTQWSPQAQSWVQFNVNKAIPVQKWFEQQNNQLVPLGGGGSAPAAAPSGGGDPAAAISSIESGGKYDAVGPVADGKGSRAYGKYQIMDFNVGPWTQEVLGRPMAPQEFLANPQAQDAVFNAKFSQYRAKYGDEGAAKAWFAGEGGMNNPGAKDVLGTTVADYGAKFTRAMGGPQPTTGTPPVQIAQAGGGAIPMPGAPTNLVPSGPPPAQMPGGAAPPNAGGQGDSAMPGGQIAPQQARDVLSLLPPGARPLGDPRTRLPKIENGFMAVEYPNGARGWVQIPKKDQQQQGSGPFAGTGMDQQAYNIVLQGNPSDPAYAAAYAHLSAPRVQFDAQSGQMITIRPNMDWARPPLGVMATPPGAPPAAPGALPAAPDAAPQQPPSTSVPIPGGGTATTTPVQSGPSKQEMAKLREAKAEAEKITKAGDDFVKEWKKATMFDRAKSMTGATTNLNTAYNAFALLAKGETLFNLGVLNGPDLEIIRRTLPDPSQIKSGVVSEAEVEAAVNKVLDILRNSIAAKEKQMPGAQAPAAPKAEGPADKSRLLFDARKAIEQGAPRDAVIQRLREMGVEEQP